MQFSHRDEYVAKRIAFHGCHLCDLGLETYVRRIVERLVSAIGHDGDQQCQSARNFDHLSALNFDQVSGGYCGA